MSPTTPPPTVPLDRRVAVRSGVDLRVLDWQPSPLADERGPDLLLVHGLASNAHLWDGMARRLADLGHHVVAVDQRGHGASDKPVPDSPAHGFDDATLVADLVDVITATGLERPIAVGQSWGGNVVIALADRHPEAVRAVVAIDGGIIDLSTRFRDADAAWAALTPPSFAGTPLDDMLARLSTMMADWPAEGLLGTLANLKVDADGGVHPNLATADHEVIVRHLFANRPSRRWPHVTRPVLLLPVRGGAGDEASVEAAKDLLPMARVHWFHDRHHDVHAQAPDEVVAVLRDAIADGFLA